MTHKTIKFAFDASPMLEKQTGVAYYNKRLIQQLSTQYPYITFVGFYYDFLGRHDEKYLPKAQNIRYQPIRIIPAKVVFQLRRLGINPPIELLIKERVDFVLFGDFFGYPSIFNVPSSVVIHDLAYIDLPESVSNRLRQDLMRLVPRQIKRSEFVITVSEFSKKRIVKEYGAKPKDVLVTPIPPPVPVHHHKTERRKTLKKLGITKPFILFLGTIEPRKNIVSLIDAYEQLPEELRAKYSLVIAGRVGWNCEKELERLEKAKKQKLDVIHVGYISDHDKEVLYGSASLFVSASHYEGFGMPVLEAMSYGVPCALSDIPSFHEAAGNTALYFSPEDISESCEKIAQLLTGKVLYKKLVEKEKSHVKKYQWGQVAKNVWGYMEKSIDLKRKG